VTAELRRRLADVRKAALAKSLRVETAEKSHAGKESSQTTQRRSARTQERRPNTGPV
jgi:hypothetical protein